MKTSKRKAQLAPRQAGKISARLLTRVEMFEADMRSIEQRFMHANESTRLAQSLNSRLQWEVNELNQTVGRAVEIMGSQSIAFEPETKRLQSKFLHMLSLPGSIPRYPEYGVGRIKQDTTIRITELDVMLASIDKPDPMHPDDVRHLRLEFAGGLYGYAISRELFKHPEHKDMIVERVAHELARLIHKTLSE